MKYRSEFSFELQVLHTCSILKCSKKYMHFDWSVCYTLYVDKACILCHACA